MNEEDSKLVKLYMDGKSTLKILEKETKELEPTVKAIVQKAGLPVEGELGRLSISTQDRWTYPQAIVDKEAEVKEMKEVAKQRAGMEGGAIATPLVVMRFTAKKPKV